MKKNISLDALSAQATCILNTFGTEELTEFIRETAELYELLHMTAEEELEFAADKFEGNLRDAREVKLLRTIYLLSKLIDRHHKSFKKIYTHYSGFWKLLEKRARLESTP